MPAGVTVESQDGILWLDTQDLHPELILEGNGYFTFWAGSTYGERLVVDIPREYIIVGKDRVRFKPDVSIGLANGYVQLRAQPAS